MLKDTQSKSFILKGDLAFSKKDRSIQTIENGYLICEDGISKGAYQALPNKYKDLPIKDYTDKLIIPGMTDLHVHAPQYTYRGIGMDLELLEWLNTHTFPEEEKYESKDYAKEAYQIFVEDLKESYTTRAVIFATVHTPATLELMQQLEESGLYTYVGKVNMDRNATKALCNANPQEEKQRTKHWIEQSLIRFQHTKPIITPRFIPSCTDTLMETLGELREEYHLRVQSHLSENLSEIAWVKELVPQAKTYGHAYDMFQMLGNKKEPAIMAHCVYSSKEELALLKEKGTYIAHCPDSNLNIASGIAPIASYLQQGLPIGLGTDVAGGASLSMARTITLAIQSSKMYWRLVDQSVPYMSFADVFYLATLGGGSYFGKVGSFYDGYEFDALILDDTKIKSMKKLTVLERLERLMYQEDKGVLLKKYVRGLSIKKDS